MHRISYSSETTDTCQHELLVNDGLVVPPAFLGSPPHAWALLAIGDRAELIIGGARRPLEPSVPVDLAKELAEDQAQAPMRLVWQPNQGSGPRPLPLEPTALHAERLGPALGLGIPGSAVHPITKRPMLIGRHLACDVVLDDVGVSALQCALMDTAAGARVLDLGSTNGTYLNGSQITDAKVRSRATLRLGQTTLEILPAGSDGRLIRQPSAGMQKLDAMLERVAPTTATVVIEGESGVGKEGIARRLHELSGRPGPFVPLNAACLRPELAATELFGHVRGAFTGAGEDHEGAFLVANHGTLFLDEIAEMPLPAQAELLRVLEARTVRKVGDTREIPVDVRLVVATHCDLIVRVRSGRFREDLFHRIFVIQLQVPPLRERPEDLDVLASEFLKRIDSTRRLSPEAWAKLKSHRWPGNVRELQNTLYRACTLSDCRVITPGNLQWDSVRCGSDEDPLFDIIHKPVLDMYRRTGYDVTETARRLQIVKSSVRRHVRATKGPRKRGDLVSM